MSPTLIPQCIGILFQNCSSRRKTGHQIFESFKEENRQCFWNMELTEAVNCLVYIGFIRPGTLFISSTQPDALNVIRFAWTNRVLRPAKGYVILTIGDVPQIQLHEIEQVNRQPVADMICGAIAKFNKNGYPATYETICMELTKYHSDLPPPSPDTIQKNIDALLSAELIYRLGDNLFLSKAPTAPYIFAKKTNVKCNAECQTGKSIICTPENEERQELASKHRKGLIARLFARKNSPAKVAPKKKEPITVSAQLPTSGWIYESVPIDRKATSLEEQRDTIQRYSCYTECVPQPEHNKRRVRMKHRRGEPALPRSPECLDYGPIDPPECLPYLGAPESLVEMEERPKRKARTRRRNICTDAARTSTPVPEGSDSAYSVSPVITEMSSESQGPSRSSSLSGARDDVLQVEHTYVNMYSHESTQFEEITQIERLVPSLQVSNV